MAKRPKKEISDRHLLLVDHYFSNGFNKTKAAEAAGFSHANAYIKRLFDREDVQEEIARRRRKLARKNEMGTEKLIEFLITVLYTNFGDIMAKLQENGYDVSCLTEEERWALRSWSESDTKHGKNFKVDVMDPMRAIELLGKHFGTFVDRVKVEGEISLVERLQRGRERVRKQTGKETEDE